MPFCSYMDDHRDYHTKPSKKEKDNTIVCHSCVKSKNTTQMKLCTKQKQTDIEDKLVTKEGFGAM